VVAMFILWCCDMAVKSSAYVAIFTAPCGSCGMSWVNMLNSSGDRMAPWGTPLSM